MYYHIVTVEGKCHCKNLNDTSHTIVVFDVHSIAATGFTLSTSLDIRQLEVDESCDIKNRANSLIRYKVACLYKLKREQQQQC
ncbi:hypothetical protein EB796_019314 [Bugula neritina]|uniref:Uncharacterized protein n=1 Tax=Bugula neritina TaxID=10212 RepID=A0A7J7J9H2_BUGNE|nr:hypothetical protein EB796_019314 [Bugula neritina]